MGGHLLLNNTLLENPNSWIQKPVENKWIQSISHTKSHESHWKTNGFKAFLILNLMNPILFFLPIIWGLLGEGGYQYDLGIT